MRVLITGGAGLLGSTLCRLAPQGVEVHATVRHNPLSGVPAHPVELSDTDAARRLFRAIAPDVVVHTAYGMEDGERDIVRATRSVAEATAEIGAELVYMSTDALLDGEHAPYAEDAPPSPVHEYGRWKAEAEQTVRRLCSGAAIIRTSLICATDPLDPRSEWIADALRRRRPLSLYVDEIRCPIVVEDLARQLWEIARLPMAERAGIWHLAGPEALSRYALGLLIAARLDLDPGGITAAWSGEAPSPRPRDLRLRTDRADRLLACRARPISALLTR